MYQPNFERIAHKIVNENMRLQPGQQVLLQLRSDAVPYGELIAIEIARAGGIPTVFLQSDELRFFEVTETPLEQLAAPVRPLSEAIRAADFYVQVGYRDGDPQRFASVTPEQERAWNERRKGRLAAIFGADSTTIWLGTEHPTRQVAQSLGLPWQQFYEMYWRAMDVDYGALRERGAALKELLEGGQHIYLSSPRGTDLHLERGERPVFSDDGLIDSHANLPAGEVYFAPIEESVEGRLILDHAYDQGRHIVGLELRFEGGIATPVGAESGFDLFQRVWDSHHGDKERLGEMGIGINNEIHQPTGFLLTDEKIMGTVHMALGNNVMMGGKNQSTLHWDMMLLQPTVLVDDRPILEAGRFLL